MSNNTPIKIKNRTFRTRTAALMAAALMASVLDAGLPASAADTTLGCDPGFYQVIRGQLAELDPATETYATIGPDNSSYNAMGYRVADGYLYGISGSTLHRIDNTGTRTNIAELDIPGGAYTGDFDDDGLLNVSRGGRDWHKIDVDTLETKSVPEFSEYTAVADITNVHGVFYGMSSDGSLFSYDQTSLEMREIGPVSGLPDTLKAYGAAWATAGGNLYVGRNSGEIYQVTGYTTSTPKASLVGRSPSTSSNDGASCPLAVPAPGLDDVDGPESESPPRTDEATEAAEFYTDNYDEIAETFTPIPEEPTEEPPEESAEPTDGSTYTFDDAGIGNGPSCVAGLDEDRPERGPVGELVTVTENTGLYETAFDSGAIDEWEIRSGIWKAADSALIQDNICGYDYTVLLDKFSVEDFQWQATFSGLTEINQGGLIFNHASTNSRSGAVVVDLADEGSTLRWGEYNERGFYQLLGSVDIDAPAKGQSIVLSVEVHGQSVSVSLNGSQVATFESRETGGRVGLIASVAQVSFDEVLLTALPAPAVATGDSE